jgi:hypothetical protein
VLPPGWLAALSDPSRQAALAAAARHLAASAAAAAGAGGDAAVGLDAGPTAALWCVGGVGAEALQLAAAAEVAEAEAGSGSRAAAAAATAIRHLGLCSSLDGNEAPGSSEEGCARAAAAKLIVVHQGTDQLSLNLGRQLAAANGVAAQVRSAAGPPATEEGSGSGGDGGGGGSGRFIGAVLLAAACGPAWGPVAAAQEQLQQLGHALLPGCAVAPGRVRW